MASPFTKDKENFTRLIHLVNDLGLQAFQETLDHYATLKATVHGSPLPTFNDVLQKIQVSLIKLKGPGKGKPLTGLQWTQLYPGRGIVVGPKDLDMILCFILLRQSYMCGLKTPVTGWDKEPAPTDTSIEGSLAQIKYIRNGLAHSNRSELSNADFNNLFTEVSQAIINISSKLPPGKFDVDEELIRQYKISPITSQSQNQRDIDNERVMDAIHQSSITLSKKIDEGLLNVADKAAEIAYEKIEKKLLSQTDGVGGLGSSLGEAKKVLGVELTPGEKDKQQPKQLQLSKEQKKSGKTGLSEKQMSLLDKNRSDLIKRVDAENGLLSVLLSKGVLNSKENDKIQKAMKQGSHDDGVEKILDILMRRDQDTFKLFCESLIEMKQEFIVNDYLTEDTGEV